MGVRKKPQEIPSRKPLSPKARGELAESVFTVKARALGIALSQPMGDNQPFDFMATTRLGTFRVQVKSAWKLIGNRYHVFIKPQQLNPYSGFDVIVIYIADHDVWYLIPASAVKGRYLKFYPHVTNSRGMYERFREGWRTLTGDVYDDTYRIGLTINAQKEE